MRKNITLSLDGYRPGWERASKFSIGSSLPFDTDDTSAPSIGYVGRPASSNRIRKVKLAQDLPPAASRDVKKIPYEEIYTNPDQMAKEFVPSCPAVMVENDCVIVTGGSLLQAFDRLEVMESTAHSIISAQEIGPIVHITDPEIEEIKEAFHLQD